MCLYLQYEWSWRSDRLSHTDNYYWIAIWFNCLCFHVSLEFSKFPAQKDVTARKNCRKKYFVSFFTKIVIIIIVLTVLEYKCEHFFLNKLLEFPLFLSWLVRDFFITKNLAVAAVKQWFLEIWKIYRIFILTH